MAKTKKSRRKAAKKKRRRTRNLTPTVGRRAMLRAADGWPVHEVLMARDWRQEAGLVQILVSRRAPTGAVVAATFLVDLGCLGVKNAKLEVFTNVAVYERGLRRQTVTAQPMEATRLDLAAKVIEEGVAYAEGLGFHPDPGFESAKRLLRGADPGAPEESVPVGGRDGKPLFVAGPYDDAKRIIEHLGRRLGADGFHFVAPLM